MVNLCLAGKGTTPCEKPEHGNNRVNNHDKSHKPCFTGSEQENGNKIHDYPIEPVFQYFSNGQEGRYY